MKQVIYTFVALIVFSSVTSAQDFYSQPLSTIDGSAVNLSQFKGKKILIYVLPFSADSTRKIAELKFFTTKYSSSVAVIGVPPTDMGFSRSDVQKLKKIYQDAGITLTIADGMNVKKGGTQQQLFRWLTSKDQNKHFDGDVWGIGDKFFLNENGELVGRLNGDIPLTHPFVERAVSR